MFEIKLSKDNEYVFYGNFDLGIMGTYKNDIVEIRFDEDDFMDNTYKHLKRKYERLHNYVNLNMTGEEKAKALTKFYLMKQYEIKEHIEEINNRFLIHIFGGIMDTDFPFWEEKDGYSQFIIPDKMPQFHKEEVQYHIFTREIKNEFYAEFGDYNESKGDIRAFIKKHFPMIDMEKLISAIYPEYLVLEGDEVVFQCSSNDCNFGIVCGAYAEIRRDYTFDDWHNF